MNSGLPIETSEIILRIIISALLGGLIGLERDVHGRAAGLRTHLLVSMGAAIFVILSFLVASTSTGQQMADPGRIAAQIVTGIGFLGAGVILKEGISVRGLTTAACLWTAAAIGMASGGGYYLIAAVGTGLALFSLIGLKGIERLYRKDSYRVLTVVAPIGVEASDIIRQVKRKNLTILNCDIERDYASETTITRLSIRLFHRGITDKLAHGIISSLEESGIVLKSVKWDHT
jgi:putative Mg2+ transporter-C (MgtC) family protein